MCAWIVDGINSNLLLLHLTYLFDSMEVISLSVCDILLDLGGGTGASNSGGGYVGETIEKRLGAESLPAAVF